MKLLPDGFKVLAHRDVGYLEVCDYVSGRRWKIPGSQFAEILFGRRDQAPLIN